MRLFQTQEEYKQFWNTLPLLASTRNLGIGLSTEERQLIALQTLVALNDYYVHLPQKISALAINPIQQARLLIDDAKYILEDLEFFKRVQAIFTQLRDRHTSFTLPAPWKNMFAILPFTPESYWAGNQRKVVVSKIAMDFGDPEFKPGVEITHWNSIPIGTYIQNLSWETSGAHPWARIAVSMRSLTIRPLAYMQPPDEDWVNLTYRSSSGYKSIVIPWKIYIPEQDSGAGQASAPVSGAASILQGVDDNTLLINGALQDLYARNDSERTSRVFKDVNKGAAVADNEPLLKNNLFYSQVNTKSGTFGYIRIFSFDAPDIVQFITGFADILKSLPQNGLIIDVRSNPGGTIPSGEGIVQLFSDQPILPSPVTFRNTQNVRTLVNSSDYLSLWQRSVNMLLDTGQVFSQGFSLTDVKQVQPIGRVYKGKIVLIIDALCYSTTDFFAAAMQDNGIAKIVGVDPITGAGGANVWTYQVLADFVNKDAGTSLLPLPRGVDINLSMRQALRVGPNAGLPMEGVGVSADYFYNLTERDVLSNNEDLIEYTSTILSKM